MTYTVEFVPLAARRRGLVLRTYQVDADGRRHGYSPVVVVVPEPGPPTAGLWLDYWPDCRCPHHRAD